VTILAYVLLTVLLLLLNGFFVLAEFAAIRMRPSRIEELVAQGNAHAKTVQQIQLRLDEFLPVFQVGITLASIGLGFVGEASLNEIIHRVFRTDSATAHWVTILVLYTMISFLHILLGELVPKSIAIRKTESSALRTAPLLQFFRLLFILPIAALNVSARAILRMLGLSVKPKESNPSEDELRIILAQSQRTGLMSFRRLLLLENIFDLGEVKVRDAMRPRDAVKILKASAPIEENLKVIRESRFSRFPLVDGSEMPLGVIHVKDLFYAGPERLATGDLRRIARPYQTSAVDAPLENALGELQRHRSHLAMVKDAAGKWVGILSLEDIIEEIVGTIEDEFETEPPIYLADTLSAGRTVLGLEASSLEEVIGQAMGRVAAPELALPVERVTQAVLERERAMSTYLGNGLAIPHARLEGLERPALIFARSESGVPIAGRDEKAHLIFILLTPSGSPRIQVRLLARICGLIDSEYVAERLLRAESPAAVVEAIRAAEPMTIS
jgi:CBS domain containing-hemolysin-like protein